MTAASPTAPDHAEARRSGPAPSSRRNAARPPRHVLAARLSLHVALGPKPAIALRDWCRLHDIGDGDVVAEPRSMPIGPRPDDDLAERLAMTPGERPRHRRMRLRRGEVPLACCDLWWLPGRMGPAMQEAFGAEILPDTAMLQALTLRRHLLAEARPTEGPCLLERRGILIAADEVAVAAFRECYRLELLA